LEIDPGAEPILWRFTSFFPSGNFCPSLELEGGRIDESRSSAVLFTFLPFNSPELTPPLVEGVVCESSLISVGSVLVLIKILVRVDVFFLIINLILIVKRILQKNVRP
jgi:hypothetical protein